MVANYSWKPTKKSLLSNKKPRRKLQMKFNYSSMNKRGLLAFAMI